MLKRIRVWLKMFLVVLVGGTVVVASVFGVPVAKNWWEQRHKISGHGESHQTAAARPRAHLASDDHETLIVPDDVAEIMGVAVAEATPVPPMEPIWLDGTLILGADHLVHVHTRFAGDVVEMGLLQSPEELRNRDGATVEVAESRPLRFGDHVKEGQLLAVIWSKDLGEKKSELVESLSRLRIEQERLKRLEELISKGAVSERSVRDAEREVEASIIAVSRAERTLISWKLNPAEIQEIRREAEDVHARTAQWGRDMVNKWARVEVRAPIDGTIIEKNVAVGDYVAADLDIFKIADLTRMDVLAHAYEEDLPVLERLPTNQRNWLVHLKADKTARPMAGHFDRIGNIIDPNQHTALVLGWVDNSNGRLRVGQFITARIDVPADSGEVAVPLSAVIDHEGQNYVFVREGPHSDRYTRRRVHVDHRRDNLVCLGPAPDSRGGAAASVMPKIGELVVTTGGVEMAAELVSLQTASLVAEAAH